MKRILLCCSLLAAGAGLLPAQSLNWISPCSDKVFCLNQGSCTEGNVFMTEQAVTFCGNSLINYSFRIDLNNDGSTDIMSSLDTVTGPFPLGTHKISWRASDNCGQVASCTYFFTIKDCNPPNLVCINGLTQNLDAPDCTAFFTADQFILNLTDNCTPVNNLDIGMRKLGEGTGFPAGTSVSYDSCDVGIHFVEIWVRDAGGLANNCQGYVLVQNSGNSCSCNLDAGIDFQGCARSAGNLKLNNYTVRATVRESSVPDSVAMIWTQQFNSTDSCFSMLVEGLPFGTDYQAVVRAFRSDGPLVGFSTFDLVLISKHILGLESFTSFYQVMAADMNNSQTVTTFDIVEGRKLLLGILDTFTSVPSWRFIRPLADPSNLLQWHSVRDTYRINYPNLLTDVTTSALSFVGVKSGDVNLSAAFGAEPEDRTSDSRVLLVEDRALTTGEVLDVPLRLLKQASAAGWQIALHIDPDLFELEGVKGIPEDHYHIRDHHLRALWYAADERTYTEEEPLLVLRLRARTSASLSEGIGLDTEVLRAELYEGPAVHPLELVFSGQDASGDPAVRFFQPKPNPFRSSTRFDVWLDAPAPLILEVMDVTGGLLYRRSLQAAEGFQSMELNAGDLPGSAVVLIYRLRAGASVYTGRLIRSE